MTKARRKPQGTSGPIVGGPDGIEWAKIRFPETKLEREWLVANLFFKGSARPIMEESKPSLTPFGMPHPNDENDIDFTIGTAEGTKLMELAEIAPLKTHGGIFENAPKRIAPKEKASIVYDLIRGKSDHQGAPGRFLVLYATEHAFKADVITIELVRRRLEKTPPKFDRVYALSIHGLDAASIWEVYPGKPHDFFRELSDDDLDRGQSPHPTEFVVTHSLTWTGAVLSGFRRLPAEFSLTIYLPGYLCDSIGQTQAPG
ncbi:hypothetical protein [Mesorhizobium cantuariense]|uniref:Uncharacterized protein n=1 Tax=Mesorhizobium cantuariense TaxID=1300275 RepID=A0ABV7MXS4_9HYPH